MHETLDFIFKTLNRHDNNFMATSKIIRNQRKFNNSIMLFAFAITGLTFLQDARIRSLEHELRKTKEEGVEK